MTHKARSPEEKLQPLPKVNDGSNGSHVMTYPDHPPSDEDEEFRDAQSVVNKRLTEQSLSLTDGEEDYTTVQTKQIE